MLALTSYFWGRLQIAEGQSGVGWILAGAPIAVLGFLAKENAALLPLLLLVSELTVLRTFRQRKPHVAGSLDPWVVLILLPLIAAPCYFVTHPGLIHYDTRPFTLAERLLTEPRVLWFYLRLLLIPDVSRFGLYHDDLPLSTGLFAPPTTLVAIGGLVVLLVAAILLRRRYPVAAFAVLFFLAAHALESTFLALEIIFEHRNYLASVGPLMLLAYLITEGSRLPRVGRAAIVLGALLLVSHAAATWVRVESWSTYEDFILNTADNHPKSARSNFMAAQLVISTIAEADGDTSELERAGEMFLDRGLEADPNCINCLIGKVVLALHVDRVPDAELLGRLSEALKSDYVGATKVSISQFSYLVKWQQSDGVKIPPAALEKLFEDALENPRWPTTGRAGIEAAFREYHEFVSRDLEKALLHAERAIAAWPDQWAYHMHKIRVLRKLGRPDAARQALSEAERLAKNSSQQAQVDASSCRDTARVDPAGSHERASNPDRTEHHPARTQRGPQPRDPAAGSPAARSPRRNRHCRG